MTEHEWLATLDPLELLTNLHGKPSWRKMRLAAVACCRRMENLLVDERSRCALETAERCAENVRYAASVGEIEYQASLVTDAAIELGHDPNNDAAHCAACCLAFWAPAPWGTFQVFNWSAPYVARAEQVGILACVFAVPHRQRRLRIAFETTWRTTDVMLLANGAYDDRAFDRLPILADALQDAGCDAEDLLNHLRDTSATHVRGCWALDLVLDKQ